MKSIIKKLFSVAVVAILALTTTSTAIAGDVSWALPNTAPFGTINGLSGNSLVDSKLYGTSTYTQTSSAAAGDKVAVLIYFHNNGNADSTSTIVKLDRPSTSAGNSFTLGGSVSGGGASKSGTTTINLSSSQTLTFIPGSLRVSKDRGQSSIPYSNEADIFNGGLDIGLVRGMHTCGTDSLCAQGSVALGFQVGSTPVVTGSKPSVITGSYLPFSEAGGFATLNGSVSPNGAATCTYFEYRFNYGQVNKTTENCGTQTTGNYALTPAYISGLASGTYEYHACARNSYGLQCGDTLNFYISRPETNQCSDGVDNDGDTFIDFPNDPGCSSATDNSEAPYNTVTQCVINNFNPSPANVTSGGYTTLSWNTTGCDYVTIDGVNYPVDGSGSFGPLYSSRTYEIKAWKSTNPGSPVTNSAYVGVTPINTTYECSDGRDNDGDGYTDFPNDPACASATGTTESPYNTVTQCVINNFTASPINVSAGGYTTLNWNTTGCDIVTVDGVNYPVDGSGSFGPLYTGRTYELKAWKNTGSSNPQISNVYVGVNTVNQTYECSDGRDNDGDGYTDYPNDPACYSYSGTTESPYNSAAINLSVYTENYSWINQDSGSVTLRGRYTGNTYGSTRTYFEYRLNGQSARTITSDISNNNSLSFNVSLYNLAQGSYEYRACASNSYTQCGVWLQFNVNQNYVNPYPTTNQPTVQTLNPIQYSTNFATLDGFYNMNGCAGTTYFEYGPNGSYGYTTPQISRSQSGSMAQSISNLLSGTTYYYRAVAQNCGGTVRGDARQFTTTNQTIRDNTPVVTGGGNTTTIIRNVTTATNIGGGAQYIRLTIDNGRDTIVRGDELIYDVTWENISRRDLEDLVLEISFPEGLQIIGADRGQIDRKANTIYVNIRDLKALEKDDMTVRAHVKGTSFKDNDPITARAIMAFENPENRAQENAIAYDSDSYLSTQNVLGASVFGLDFLPGTLAGWLFIILLLILVILIIRYTMRGREEHHHYYPTDKGPMQPVAPVMTPVAPMVTKTTEVEYTPYRPTPKL